jgi:hypothetical protein
MEAVIGYEYLTGARGEKVSKKIAIVSENSIESFRFLALLKESPCLLHIRSYVG